MEFAMNVVPAHGPRPAARRAAGIATLLVLLAAAPALAEEATPPKVNGFKPIERPATPGERAASQAYARPGTNPAGSMLGITGDSDSDSRTGVEFQMSGGVGWGNVNSMGTRRSNELLGDGVSVYDAEPFYSNSRSYYSPYTGYQQATPRLQYNQSFLRHMYNGNIGGLPSVTAPLEFWDSRR
jgi:hypothetical protein